MYLRSNKKAIIFF